MADELIEAGIVKQDIEDIDEILKKAGKPLPVLREEDTDVSFLPVTEAFLAGIIARKERLQRRNLQIEIKDREGNRITARPSDTLKVLEEGIHKIGCLEKYWDKVRIYQRDGKEVSRFNNSEWIYYYIQKEMAGNSKVSSVYNTSGECFGRESEFSYGGKKEVVDIIISFLAALFFGGVVLAFILASFLSSFMPYIWFYFFIIIVNSGIWRCFTKCVNKLLKWPSYTRRRIPSRKVTAKLLEKEPEFCLEKFLGTLNSKLLRLLYADGTEEIGSIVSCDMAQFLQDHEDVVNCEFRNFWFTDMREDKDYMYLDVVYKVTLYRDKGINIKRKKQMIYLQLARPLQGIMESDLYNDWSITKIETKKK